MNINIISLFPGMFDSIINYGITKRAIKNKLLCINILNLRDFSDKRNNSIDDKPYGGGVGMVIRLKPILEALKKAKSIIGKNPFIIYLTPQGNKLNHEKVIEISKRDNIILLCGRYNGIDSRILQNEVNEEISIGDYILTGGELASMVLIDSISRFRIGVVGNKKSIYQDSFNNNLLEHPQFTRPAILNDLKVPKILLSGKHKEISKWKLKQSLGMTWLKRPDLLKKNILNNKELLLLKEFIKEFNIGKNNYDK